jgi:hypothetical protein
MSTQTGFYLNPEQRKIFESLFDQLAIETSKKKTDAVALVSDEEGLANMCHWLED